MFLTTLGIPISELHVFLPRSLSLTLNGETGRTATAMKLPSDVDLAVNLLNPEHLRLHPSFSHPPFPKPAAYRLKPRQASRAVADRLGFRIDRDSSVLIKHATLGLASCPFSRPCF